jgi:hypothetical protein
MSSLATGQFLAEAASHLPSSTTIWKARVKFFKKPPEHLEVFAEWELLVEAVPAPFVDRVRVRDDPGRLGPDELATDLALPAAVGRAHELRGGWKLVDHARILRKCSVIGEDCRIRTAKGTR